VTIAVRNEHEWRGFCQAIGSPEWVDDKRFSSLQARLDNQDELDGLISEWTLQLDRDEVADLLQSRKIPAGPVLGCGSDTYDDPHLQARDYFQVVTQPEAGTFPMSGPIWRLASQVSKRHEPAPTLGQHNAEVLRDLLGRSSDELKRLGDEKVIGTVPLEGSDMGGVRRAARGRW
jgi:crotonobetainyl-CoA:carnitine CoA-transferase CaiB-like acyl-CoA transferase